MTVAAELPSEPPLMELPAEPHHMDYHPTPSPGMDHSRMDHSPMDHNGMDHGGMDHNQMDHNQMDHNQMDHNRMDHTGMLYQQPIAEESQTDFYTIPNPNVGASSLHHTLFEDWSSMTTTLVDDSFQLSAGWPGGLPSQNPGQAHGTSG